MLNLGGDEEAAKKETRKKLLDIFSTIDLVTLDSGGAPVGYGARQKKERGTGVGLIALALPGCLRLSGLSVLGVLTSVPSCPSDPSHTSPQRLR